jgi:DNA-binding transcriptional LysR family regulator
VLIFDRRGKRAQLTAAGAELLEQGRLLMRAAGLLAPAAGGPWHFATALVGALALLAVAHGLARRQPAATRPRMPISSMRCTPARACAAS